MRIKGATELFNKTKAANLAGWKSMIIFSKREAMYATMKLENADESSILVRDTLLPPPLAAAAALVLLMLPLANPLSAIWWPRQNAQSSLPLPSLANLLEKRV